MGIRCTAPFLAGNFSQINREHVQSFGGHRPLSHVLAPPPPNPIPSGPESQLSIINEPQRLGAMPMYKVAASQISRPEWEFSLPIRARAWQIKIK